MQFMKVDLNSECSAWRRHLEVGELLEVKEGTQMLFSALSRVLPASRFSAVRLIHVPSTSQRLFILALFSNGNKMLINATCI